VKKSLNFPNDSEHDPRQRLTFQEKTLPRATGFRAARGAKSAVTFSDMEAGCTAEHDAAPDAQHGRHRAPDPRADASKPRQPSNGSTIREWFHRFAQHASNVVGAPATFVVAVLLIVVWAIAGPLMGFSEAWQLIINTGTTILTFLMVFLIQNTQNRDARAIHLKLDELIHGVKGARNRVIDLENCTDEELAQLEKEFKRLRERDAHRRQ
jgi:low affinity Fe/Cu permease